VVREGGGDSSLPCLGDFFLKRGKPFIGGMKTRYALLFGVNRKALEGMGREAFEEPWSFTVQSSTHTKRVPHKQMTFSGIFVGGTILSFTQPKGESSTNEKRTHHGSILHVFVSEVCRSIPLRFVAFEWISSWFCCLRRPRSCWTFQ